MKKKFIVVDGANYLFRAFYAIPPLSNDEGMPTNALYGFTQMLLSLIKQEKPNYIAVALDTKEPTFRNELYSEYKANRKEPPEDLVPQFPYVKKIIDALNISILEYPGYEADDIIATVAQKFASADLDIMIVSSDKDLMQLVNGNVCILDTMKKKCIKKNEVIEKFGVPPERVQDVLALSGDTSDNIPGIPGVGPKTATKLIVEYGSFENVLENAEKIKGALGEKIRANIDLALLSQKLVLVEKDVPLKEKTLDIFECKEGDVKKMGPLFHALGFKRLADQMAPKTVFSNTKYQLLNTQKKFEAFLEQAKESKVLCLDLETTSLNPFEAKIVGFALATASESAVYVPVGHNLQLGEEQLRLDDVIKALQPLLLSKEKTLVGQNIKYDLKILLLHGMKCENKLFDTMVASYVLNPSERHGLDELAHKYFSHTMISFEEVCGKGKKQITFDDVPLQKALEYAAEDADLTLRLYELFSQNLKTDNAEDLFYTLEMPLLKVLMHMELQGFKIDVEFLQKLSHDFEKRLTHLEKNIYALAGDEFNINSPKQLGEILFGKLQLSGGKKTKTGYSTKQDILEDLALQHELPRHVLEYRSFSKLKSTYVDALPKLLNQKTKRVHTSFNQTVAATGRLSSSDPNLQNIPIRSEEGRKIRKAFVAPEGYVLIDCDYSQIELRILAQLSQDNALLTAFAANEDIHALTASKLFDCNVHEVTSEQRSVGKTVNFGVIYGQSAFSLSKQLAIEPAKAKTFIDLYFKQFPKVLEYREKVLDGVKKEGYTTTLFGRRRYFPDIASPNQMVKQASERMAFNSVFQGTAADIIKKGMVEIEEKLSSICKDAKMILQVHDELIFEAPEADAQNVMRFVKEKMEQAVKLDVPLLVEAKCGINWDDAH